jgi:ATP-dependent DNA ligase
MLEELEPLKRKAAPIDDSDLAALKGVTFVEPVLVCEVEYLEITKSTKKMRAPVFKRLRPDKAADECLLEPSVRGKSSTKVGQKDQKGS